MPEAAAFALHSSEDVPGADMDALHAVAENVEETLAFFESIYRFSADVAVAGRTQALAMLTWAKRHGSGVWDAAAYGAGGEARMRFYFLNPTTAIFFADRFGAVLR